MSNINNIVIELFSENLIRGRGLFAKSAMMAQVAAPDFTPVYAALIAIVSRHTSSPCGLLMIVLSSISLAGVLLLYRIICVAVARH